METQLQAAREELRGLVAEERPPCPSQPSSAAPNRLGTRMDRLGRDSSSCWAPPGAPHEASRRRNHGRCPPRGCTKRAIPLTDKPRWEAALASALIEIEWENRQLQVAWGFPRLHLAPMPPTASSNPNPNPHSSLLRHHFSLSPSLTLTSPMAPSGQASRRRTALLTRNLESPVDPAALELRASQGSSKQAACPRAPYTPHPGDSSPRRIVFAGSRGTCRRPCPGSKGFGELPPPASGGGNPPKLRTLPAAHATNAATNAACRYAIMSAPHGHGIARAA